MEAARPSETCEAKQEATREETQKRGKPRRITRLTQERLHSPLTAAQDESSGTPNSRHL
jgi:hypothetical protein